MILFPKASSCYPYTAFGVATPNENMTNSTLLTESKWLTDVRCALKSSFPESFVFEWKIKKSVLQKSNLNALIFRIYSYFWFNFLLNYWLVSTTHLSLDLLLNEVSNEKGRREESRVGFCLSIFFFYLKLNQNKILAIKTVIKNPVFVNKLKSFSCFVKLLNIYTKVWNSSIQICASAWRTFHAFTTTASFNHHSLFFTEDMESGISSHNFFIYTHTHTHLYIHTNTCMWLFYFNLNLKIIKHDAFVGIFKASCPTLNFIHRQPESDHQMTWNILLF